MMRARQFRLTLSGLALAAMFIGGLALAQSAPKPVRPNHRANVIAYIMAQPANPFGNFIFWYPDFPIDILVGFSPDGTPEYELSTLVSWIPDTEVRTPKTETELETEVNTLKSRIETLSTQLQAAEQKADAAEEQVKSLQTQVQELTGDTQDLQRGVKLLPWWRATAVSFGILALVAMFEWRRMRRRFVALAAMTDALSPLDLKIQGDIREGPSFRAAKLSSVACLSAKSFSK